MHAHTSLETAGAVFLGLGNAFLASFLALLLAAESTAAPNAAKVENKADAKVHALPAWKEVSQLVRDHFQSQGVQSGDLISRSRAKPLLDKLGRMGWPAGDCTAILQRVPDDGDFIVKQLSTPSGQQFMRQVGKIPRGFDRVDHLAKLPQGEQKVRELIKGPGGYKMIEYMATTPGGAQLGKMLSANRGGQKFNAPTGKLYTPDAVLAALEARHSIAAPASQK